LLINSASDIPNWVATIFDLRTSPDAEPVPALLLLASKDLLMNSFFFDWRSWSLVLAAVLALSALCWLPFVRGLTHSIDQMTKATAEIAEGRFDVAVKVKRQDELGHLATSINRMASRLETFTRGQKRFLGDVAHELRSPLGRMQLAIGILERKAPEEAQQNVTDLREDIDLMAGLTDGLLQVARSGAKPEVLALQPVNVASIVQQAARREIPSNIAFESKVDESVNVKAHPEYLTAALSNLLRNAVRYAGESGPIKLAAQNERDTVVITVADSGPGVPEDALDKIFTPFYRLDDSRTSRTGGAGLGLAIVRTSIEACGGDVVARNRPEGGLEVEIKLPRA
jgi:two-component system sensor histidine kinase CpxA